MSDWQVAVVGGGPGGYGAALRCAQLGLKTVCIDNMLGADGKTPSLGGTCLNIGCIPSKALLEDSLHYSRLQMGHPAFKVTAVKLDLNTLMQRKQQVVDGLCRGVGQLLKGNAVETITGTAQLQGSGLLLLDGKAEISAEHIILAPGSVPVQIPVAEYDGERIVDSTGALSFAEVPKRLAVIGAGAIGLELGSVWARLGSQVTVLEALEDFLPALDRDMARLALRSLTGQGLDIKLGCQVTGSELSDQQEVSLSWRSVGGDQGSEQGETEIFDKVIVAVGRRPATDGLLAEGCGLRTDERGFIAVDASCATALDKVWAVGDAVRGPMLAHKATEEGVMVAERIAGEPAEVNYGLIPSVIYTHPEVATVGKSEADCAEEGIACRSGSFNFAANGRALAAGEGEGKVKLIGEPVPVGEGSEGGEGSEDIRLVGAQVVGPSAAELVQQVAIAMEFGAVAEDLALMTFSHPTLSECLHEAALDLAGRPLHQLKRRGAKK